MPELTQQPGATDQSATDLNAFNKGKFGKCKKCKGKGKGDQKGKGKGEQQQLNAASPAPPPASGCFICGGKHWARDCPKRVNQPQQPVTASVIKLCAIKDRASPTAVRNSFQTVQVEDDGPPGLMDSDDEEEDETLVDPAPSGGPSRVTSKPGRWNIWSKVTKTRQRKGRDACVASDDPTTTEAQTASYGGFSPTLPPRSTGGLTK